MVDAADQPRHRRLAGAGVPGEDEVPGDRGRLQAGLVAQLLDAEHGDLPVHLPLHPLQPDQGVELRQQLVEARRSGRLRLGGCSGSAPASRPASRARRPVPGEPRVGRRRAAGRRCRATRRRADGRQLGSGRDGGVADDAHRRLAERAGRRGDLREGLGVGSAACGEPCAGERAQDRVGASRHRRAAARLRRRSPAWRSLPPAASRPVASRPWARTRPRRRPARALRRGRLRVHPGGRRPGPQRVDGLGQREPRRGARSRTAGCRRPSGVASGGRPQPELVGLGRLGHRAAGGSDPTSSTPPVEAVPNFSARNRRGPPAPRRRRGTRRRRPCPSSRRAGRAGR